jgi:6-pyruvoyltetrahydropterin/6-carboxytetrahydropterin synthase
LYEVSYETTFCATHRLLSSGQPCEPLHGHDWRVEVTAATAELDRDGLVVDFEHLKRALSEVTSRFHYGDIGSHPDLAGQSPSAEVMAHYFFIELKKLLGPSAAHLKRVRVFEAPGCSATYVEG